MLGSTLLDLVFPPMDLVLPLLDLVLPPLDLVLPPRGCAHVCVCYGDAPENSKTVQSRPETPQESAETQFQDFFQAKLKTTQESPKTVTRHSWLFLFDITSNKTKNLRSLRFYLN